MPSIYPTESRIASAKISRRKQARIKSILKTRFFLRGPQGKIETSVYNTRLAAEIALNPRQQLLIEFLLKFAKGNAFSCWTSIDTIAKEIGLTERPTRSLLVKLDKLMVIDREMRGGLHQTNLYRINTRGLLALAKSQIAKVRYQKTAPLLTKKQPPTSEPLKHEHIYIPKLTNTNRKRLSEGLVRLRNEELVPAYDKYAKAVGHAFEASEYLSFTRHMITTQYIEEAETPHRLIAKVFEYASFLEENKWANELKSGVKGHTLGRLLHIDQNKRAVEAISEKRNKVTRNLLEQSRNPLLKALELGDDNKERAAVILRQAYPDKIKDLEHALWMLHVETQLIQREARDDWAGPEVLDFKKVG